MSPKRELLRGICRVVGTEIIFCVNIMRAQSATPIAFAVSLAMCNNRPWLKDLEVIFERRALVNYTIGVVDRIPTNIYRSS